MFKNKINFLRIYDFVRLYFYNNIFLVIHFCTHKKKMF